MVFLDDVKMKIVGNYSALMFETALSDGYLFRC